ELKATEAFRQEVRPTLILYCSQVLPRKRPGPCLTPRMTHNHQARGKSFSRGGQAQQPRQEASQAPLAMADSKEPGPLHLVRCVVPMLHRGVEFSPGITNETRIQRRRGIVLRHLFPAWRCHAYLLWKQTCPHSGIIYRPCPPRRVTLQDSWTSSRLCKLAGYTRPSCCTMDSQPKTRTAVGATAGLVGDTILMVAELAPEPSLLHRKALGGGASY